MDWTQAGTIIGINIALVGALAGLIIYVVSKLDSDVKSLCTRLDGHAQRIDQVYGIIIQMLKDRK